MDTLLNRVLDGPAGQDANHGLAIVHRSPDIRYRRGLFSGGLCRRPYSLFVNLSVNQPILGLLRPHRGGSHGTEGYLRLLAETVFRFNGQ